MRFNYGLEKKRFEENWERLRKEYREAGMDEESIQKMYEYDWDDFKRERTWCRHNCFLNDMYGSGKDGDCIEEEGMHPLLLHHKDAMTNEMETIEEIFGWMEDIEDEKLYRAVMALNDDQKTILTMRVFEEKTMKEIGEAYGISVWSVADRIKVIYKNIKKVYA